MSILLHKRSEITCLACSVAASGSLCVQLCLYSTYGQTNENTFMNAPHTHTHTPGDEDFLEAGVDEVGNKGAVIPPDGLDTFAVHLVICVCLGVVQACISE